MQPAGLDLLRKGVESARQHPLLLAFYVALNLLFNLLPPIDAAATDDAMLLGLLALVMAGVQAWLSVGLMMFALANVRGQRLPSIFSARATTVAKLIYAGFLQGMMVAAGLIFLVVPGFYLLLVWSQTSFLILDGAPVHRAIFRDSFVVTRDRKLFILAALSWVTLPLVAGIAVQILCTFAGVPTALIVSLLLWSWSSASAVVAIFGAAWLYRYLTDVEAGDAAATSAGTAVA
ncbi:MAG TPA: hypothetical protein VEL28_19180 [Candidatus Binatia bacterium]|nr:hypothetical protein [Candidatus Binatia bacterium]